MFKAKKPFRVIVAGGRDFCDYTYLEASLDHLLQNVKAPIIIVCGAARGADTLGEKYAKARGYPVHRFPAEWDKFGRSAGYIRNEQMAQNADALVAFWDEESRGTKHMIDLAYKYHLQIRIKRYKK